jgi:hypothetical protein
LHAVGAKGMVAREEELLARTKSWKANIPVQEVDLLIVDEIGKNISGAGMDTKVVNRSSEGPNKWPGVPTIRRIYVRDLTPVTAGNAVGVGFADVISDRLFRKIDFNATWINALTGGCPAAGFTPMHFPSDRACLEKIIPTCGKLQPLDCTIAWIHNSLELGEMMVSENLLPELSKNPQIEVLDEPREFEFDSEGELANTLQPLAVAH